MIQRAIHLVRCLLVDRTGQTLLMAAAILGLAGWCIDEPLPPENDQAFWYEKLSWRGNADAVILGDSRLHRGLSPKVMAAELPGTRVLNFGFSSVEYSPEYLDAAERIFDQRSRQKIALLGVTPHSLRDRRESTNQFFRSSETFTPFTHQKARWLGWVERRWPALSRQVIEALVRGRNRASFKTRQHPDGWVESGDSQINPAPLLAVYRRIQQQHPVDDRIIHVLLSRVREWTSQGIHVYGFRPPTCPEMEETESDFSEAAFVEAFENAGGVWLTPSTPGLRTFDGSHLDAESAMLLSTRVAHTIQVSQRLIAERPTDDSKPQ